MISSEELLKPISEAQPCGEDLYYDPAFQELQTMLLGKPETQFSAAEEPDWKSVHKRCLELTQRSKDLRVGATLCVTALQMEGWPGLKEALVALSGTVERCWESVHPRLDPDDGNDPLQRVNIIASLATPVGTYGDPMRFLERLRSAPLAKSSRMGKFSLRDISLSQGAAPPEGDKAPPSPAQIDAAFRDTSVEELAALQQSVTEALAAVTRMDEFLTGTIGASKAPNLELLAGELKAVSKALAPYLGNGEAPADDAPAASEDEVGGAPASTGAGASRGPSGEIRSRKDVLMAFDRICQYYSTNEPSSPVPHVVKRARRLAEMNFMQIAEDLSPDAVAQLRSIFGEKEDSA